MKTYTTLLIALLISISSFAQQGINYKAIIKDDLDNVIADTDVVVLFTIYEGDELIEDVYVEQHAYTTDQNGFIVLNIGTGNTADNFNTINWGGEEHFLNVQINVDGAGLTELGTTQFMEVPYAKQAEKATTADLATIALTANNVTTKIDQLNDAKSDDDGLQNGSSVFLGVDSGLADDGTNNRNTGLGFQTLKANTFGYNNVANGHSALKANTEGHSNIANGANALAANTTGYSNTVNGSNALAANIDGFANTATGFEAMRFNTTGKANTANGSSALRNNTTGGNNTANGSNALYSNTTGASNTANGFEALNANTTGYSNTANGAYALDANTTGINNTANGLGALGLNTTGNRNTANGTYSLNSNTTGLDNTAIGFQALNRNTTGYLNTAIGKGALFYNTTGNFNSALGTHALINNTTGNNNTANGTNALEANTVGSKNSAFGENALASASGSFNTALGTSANFQLTTGNNNTAIGYLAQVPNNIGSNQVRIGNYAVTSASIQVGWTVPSDKRWKENIRELPYGLDMVMQLQPVDYTRKNNERKTREMGFIAQDLEALLTKVGYTDQGFLTKGDDNYLSVRYNDFIALLTKAIQEQQTIIDAQNEKIEAQVSENVSQDAAIASLLQRMNALETNNK